MILAKRKRPGLYVGTCSIYPDEAVIPENIRGGGGGGGTRERAENTLSRIFMPMGVHVGMRGLHNYNGSYDLEIFKGNESAAPVNQDVFGGCTCLEEVGFMISPDGKVRPCCSALDEDFVIGDLLQQSFGDILSGATFLELRHNLRLDQRSGYKECAHCGGSFSDMSSAAAYWGKRLAAREFTDSEEISYLSRIASMGGIKK